MITARESFNKIRRNRGKYKISFSTNVSYFLKNAQCFPYTITLRNNLEAEFSRELWNEWREAGWELMRIEDGHSGKIIFSFPDNIDFDNEDANEENEVEEETNEV